MHSEIMTSKSRTREWIDRVDIEPRIILKLSGRVSPFMAACGGH